MIVHNFDPVLIDFGIVQIRWYSLAYVLGILAGWWYGRSVIKKQIQDTSQKNYLENFDDLRQRVEGRESCSWYHLHYISFSCR